MPYKAFVSSTFEDLKEHRAEVLRSLRQAGFSVDPMEDWTAATARPKRFSQDRLEGCDLCVLLVALRRGHVPDGETLSITQLEHSAAVERGIDVLVFMLDEQAPWPRRFDELDKDPEVRRWREELKETKGVGFFNHLPDSVQLAPALTRWLAERIAREGSAIAASSASPAAAAAEGLSGPEARDSATWRRHAPRVATAAIALLAVAAVGYYLRDDPPSPADDQATGRPPPASGVPGLDLQVIEDLHAESLRAGAEEHAAELAERARRLRAEIRAGGGNAATFQQAVALYQRANLDALLERGDALLAALAEPAGAPVRDFSPASFEPARAHFELGRDAAGQDSYRLAFDELHQAVELLEESLDRGRPRAQAWQRWHGFAKDYGERRLGGASGRYLGARFSVTGRIAGDGEISADLDVVGWCKSNNTLWGAPGRFRIEGPFATEELRVKCGAGKERQVTGKIPLTERVLLDHDPSEISVSREYDG